METAFPWNGKPDIRRFFKFNKTMSKDYLITFSINSKNKNQALLFANTILRESKYKKQIQLIEIKKSSKEELEKIFLNALKGV